MKNDTNTPESDVSNPTRWSTGRQSATALAAGLGLTLGAGAQANIIYTDVNPDEVIDDFGESFGIDLDNDGSDDFTIDQFAQSTGFYGEPIYAAVQATGAGSNSVMSSDGFFYSTADVLSAGDPIDATQNFNNAAYLVYNANFVAGNWEGVSNGFLGLSFDIAGATHFGWAQLSVSSTSGEGPLTVTLHDYAYESTPRGAIPAGATVSAVPEPGTVALLAMGALPLLGLRRRRRARVDA